MNYVYFDTKDEQHLEERKYLIEQYFSHNPTDNKNVVWLDSQQEWMKVGNRNDTLIAPDLFCLGQSIVSILKNLSHLLEQRKRIIIIKNQFDFKDDHQNRSLIQALQIAAQIEQQSREYFSPADLNKRNVNVGRPKGSKSINKVLAAQHEEIENALSYGVKISTLAKRFGLTRNTVRKYINENVREELRPNNKPPRS